MNQDNTGGDEGALFLATSRKKMKKVLGVIAAALITASASHAQSEATLPTAADLPKGCLDAALSSLSGLDPMQDQLLVSVTDGSLATKRVAEANNTWYKLAENTSEFVRYVILEKLQDNSKPALFERGGQLLYKYEGNYFEQIIPGFYPDVTSRDNTQAKLTVYCAAASCGGFDDCTSNLINPSGKEFAEKMERQLEYFTEPVKLARRAGASQRRINQETSSFKQLQKKAIQAARKAPATSHAIFFTSN
jgi:hypothetical protein